MFGIKKEDSFSRKSLKVILFFTVLFSPIVFSLKHYNFFTTPKYVFISFASILCLWFLGKHILESKFLIDKKTKIFIAISTAIVFWLFISSLFGLNFNASFWSNFNRHEGFLTYLFCFILLISSVFAFNKDSIYVPMKAFVFGGLFASFYIYLGPSALGIDLDFLNYSSNAGSFGNTTYAALFLVFPLFISAILFFKEKSKKRFIWLFSFVFILINPVFFNLNDIFAWNIKNFFEIAGDARAGVISIFIGLISSLILYFYRNSNKVYRNISKAASLIIVLVVVFVLFGIFNTESKLRDIIIENNEGARLVYWDIAIDAIYEKPVTGFGLENFSSIHKRDFDPILLSPNYPNEPWADKPHNNLLEIAFSSGIPGLILYLSLVVFLLVSLIRKCFVSEGKDKITASLFFGLIAAYIFQLFFAFDTMLSIQAFFVISGIVSVFCFGEIKAIEKRDLNKLINLGIISLMTIFCILIFYFFSYKIGHESKMLRKMVEMPIPERVLIFEDVMKISPAGSSMTESHFIDYVVKGYRENWASFEPDIREKGEEELRFLLDYSSRKSDENIEDLRFALISSKIANMLFASSEVKDLDLLDISKKYGERAIKNSPGNNVGYQTLSESFILEGKYDEAMKLAEIVVDLNPKAPSAHDLVLFIAKIKKDEALVIEKMEYARSFIPDYNY